MDTFFRQFQMLQLLPRHPKKVDTTQLQSALHGEGHNVDVRTIQRDLERLSRIFPLRCDDRSKPYGWSWNSDEMLDLPGMNPATALTFVLAAEHLKPLLPSGVQGLMQPYFQRAEAVLDSLEWNTVKQWRHKIRVLPKGQPLLPPEIRAGVHDAISQSLMANRRFRAIYCPIHRPPTEYEVNPLALVARGNVSYLVATTGEKSELKQFALHRFQEVEPLQTEATTPPGFCLDDYIRSGEFDYPVQEKTIRLKAMFDKYAAHHLSETPLSSDQTISDVDDDWILLTATVPDTLELRRWLMSFGDEVEIVGPKKLRQEFHNTAIKLNKIYGDE